VRTILPEIFPEVAVMAVVPLATEVTRPPLLTVATAFWDDLQVTSMVISWVFLSESVPEAVNCWVTPTGMLRLAGAIDMEASLLVDLTPVTTFPPPHVFANTDKKPNNIAKQNLISFTGKF